MAGRQSRTLSCSQTPDRSVPRSLTSSTRSRRRLTAALRAWTEAMKLCTASRLSRLKRRDGSRRRSSARARGGSHWSKARSSGRREWQRPARGAAQRTSSRTRIMSHPGTALHSRMSRTSKPQMTPSTQLATSPRTSLPQSTQARHSLRLSAYRASSTQSSSLGSTARTRTRSRKSWASRAGLD